MIDGALVKMTLDEYGKAVRSAYEIGYMDGCRRPQDASRTERIEKAGLAFWDHVLDRIAKGIGV